MIMNCIPLNLNINPVTIDHDRLKIDYQTRINAEYLNPEFVTLLNNNQIHISYLESFYSPPKLVQGIHTDEFGGDYAKINFIYGGAGSLMHWYKVKKNINHDPRKTSANTNYIPWKPYEVELIESNALNYPSLVQAGCPHNITNKDEWRLCITIVLHDMVTRDRITMHDAQLRLSEFLIK